MKSYLVKKCSLLPGNSPEEWSSIDAVSINIFRPESTAYPHVSCKMLHDGSSMAGFFEVGDRFVRSVQTEHNASVCTDSCVEFFFAPLPDAGYFNFEINAGGTLHCSHILDHTRTPDGFGKMRKMTAEECSCIDIKSSLPPVIEPEITENTKWHLRFCIPFEFFDRALDIHWEAAASHCRANFFKCGDKTSHPHWASWTELPKTNFHLPECFGELIFA